MIQLAKCFLTCIRLKTVKNSKKFDGYQAIKGCAIHLPLEFEETHSYVAEQTLTSADALNFIVHGLPTIKNNIWKGLVNLDHVYHALDWLKENNPLYSNIIINRTLLKSKSDFLFNTPEISNVQYDKQTKSYLKKIKDLPNENQYTIIDLDNCNSNEPDIDKYSLKKI